MGSQLVDKLLYWILSQHIVALFGRLAEACPILSLAKCKVATATLTYVGLVVGQGPLRPVDTKVQGVMQYPVPATKPELMCFFSLLDYCWAFCKNCCGTAY